MSCEHEEVIRTDKGYECGTCCQPMTVKPAAQEAGNDQEVPPQPKCKNCGKFKAMHQGWRWCDIPAKPNSFFQPDDEPELNPVSAIPQRYALDHRVLSEPPVASESWEWDKQRHIAMGQFAKKLIEELGTAEAENARLTQRAWMGIALDKERENTKLRELIREVSGHGVATSYLTPELRAKLATIAS